MAPSAKIPQGNPLLLAAGSLVELWGLAGLIGWFSPGALDAVPEPVLNHLPHSPFVGAAAVALGLSLYIRWMTPKAEPVDPATAPDAAATASRDRTRRILRITFAAFFSASLILWILGLILKI